MSLSKAFPQTRKMDQSFRTTFPRALRDKSRFEFKKQLVLPVMASAVGSTLLMALGKEGRKKRKRKRT